MPEKTEKATGRYVYDKKTKKVIKISDEISSVTSSDTPSCPHGGCCGGSCPHGGH